MSTGRSGTTSPSITLGGLELQRLDPYRWLIPRQGRMRVEGLIFADESLMGDILAPGHGGEEAVRQVANVACLPGIVGRSIGMPDLHWGYGFAIGGVAAFDPNEGGVVSPGGVGYDINCGVRLLRSDLSRQEGLPYLPPLMNQIMRDVPAGVGSQEGVDELRRELPRHPPAPLPGSRKSGPCPRRGERARGPPPSRGG